MYSVSSKFNEAIAKNTRRFFWTGIIETTSGVSYSFDDADILKGSGSITRSCCGNSEIELGSVYASELDITLFLDIDRYTLTDAKISLFYHLYLEDGSTETIPMGIFEISEANRNVKTLEITAYDYMLRFDKDLEIDASSGTAYNYLNMISTNCKVELAQSQSEINALPNGNETLGVYADNDIETYRDLLFYVAQVLGCVCQIDREGKLKLIPYGNSSVLTVEQKHRFESTYSDFVTRYTAISSTNMNTEESEYYALSPDDGLTMNLGVNPLMQFGSTTSRARIISRILNAIAIIEYVPFDSKTIGNPALDPMDCLVLSGGHADAKKISCITSITDEINGKQTLKCVGKNPRLAEAKSKTDKNIEGLIGQVSENKAVYYNFINASPYTIGSSFTQVLEIDFVAKESANVMFFAQILMDLNGEENATLTVSYRLNGIAVDSFYPAQIMRPGKQMITLFFPIGSVTENSANTFAAQLSLDSGTGTIGEQQIRATLSGQGLIAEGGDWNGRISVSDVLSDIPMPEVTLAATTFTENLSASAKKYTEESITQKIAVIPIGTVSFGYYALGEDITVE